MSSIVEKVRLVLRGLREDRGRTLWRVIRERWSFEQVSYGLRRDLQVPFEAPAGFRPWNTLAPRRRPFDQSV